MLIPYQNFINIWNSIYSLIFLQVRRQYNVFKGLYSLTFSLLFPGSSYGVQVVRQLFPAQAGTLVSNFIFFVKSSAPMGCITFFVSNYQVWRHIQVFLPRSSLF
jgi:predicted ABC-type exoprotein transport system permease subunit